MCLVRIGFDLHPLVNTRPLWHDLMTLSGDQGGRIFINEGQNESEWWTRCSRMLYVTLTYVSILVHANLQPHLPICTHCLVCIGVHSHESRHKLQSQCTCTSTMYLHKTHNTITISQTISKILPFNFLIKKITIMFINIQIFHFWIPFDYIFSVFVIWLFFYICIRECTRTRVMVKHLLKFTRVTGIMKQR